MEPARPTRTLGELLRHHRQAAALTQQEVALRSGVSIRTLREWERDRLGRPRRQSLQRLAEALGLSRAEEAALLAALDRADGHEAGGGAARRGGSGKPDGSGPGSGSAHRLRIGVLGPLTVERGSATVDVGPAMPRRLLAILAVQPRQVVPRERIVDLLWGHDPPRTCLSSVHVYVSRLRALLEPGRRGRDTARVLVQSRDGYLLELDDDQLDLARFDRLDAQARAAHAAGDRTTAARAYAEAVRCWRGPVLADIGGHLAGHPVAVAAADRRIAAVMALADLLADPVTAGRSGDGRSADGPDAAALDGLRALAVDEPLHEGVHARLMLTLAGRGEQAAALAVFDGIRRRLDEHLGLRPGAELAEAHLRVLRQRVPTRSGPGRPGSDPQKDHGPPARTAPAQLPPDVPAFTGRTDDLRRLRDLTGRPSTVGLATISGMAGVGKTALAVHFAHLVRERYPDGQLYANLNGYAPGAARRPLEVLAPFLHALGLAPERVPTDLDEATALYRSMLAGQRMIILLDNAAGADQVRPLLPGAAGCLVLVTSRDSLAGLTARDGAQPLRLDVLSLEHSLELLARVLGADRVRAEPRAAVELSRLCAHLPLALRIAAAKLGAHGPATISGYVTELREGNRLAALDVGDDDQAAVRAAFDLSYAALPEPARVLFRRVGLVPGPDLTVDAAAALAGRPVAATGPVLAQLVDAHLVTARGGGRYACHDLLRLYSLERFRVEDGDAARTRAIGRLFDWYLDRAAAAATLLYPQFLRLPGARGATGLPFASHSEASGWLDAEHANLMAAIKDAAEHGPRPQAWLLADALRGYFVLRLHLVDWVSAARAALAAAQAERDALGQAGALISLGSVHVRRCDFDEAIAVSRRGLDLARRAGWEDGELALLNGISNACMGAGNLREAVGHLTEALVIARRTSAPATLSVILNNLGNVHLQLGHLERAAAYSREALELSRRTGSRGAEAISLTNLGETYHALGRLSDALGLLTGALTRHHELGSRGGNTEALRQLAAVNADAGHFESALDLAQAAMSLARDIGDSQYLADVLVTVGVVDERRGRPDGARAHYQEAYQVARRADLTHSGVDALIGLAATGLADHPAGATARATEALRLTRRYGFGIAEGTALATLARVRLAEGDAGRAVHLAGEALDLQQATGHRLGQARTLVILGHAVGEGGGARGLWQDALAIFEECGAGEARSARALLRRGPAVEPVP